MKVLVTGGTGFVGMSLIERLVSGVSFEVWATLRRKSQLLPPRVESVVVGEIDGQTQWVSALKDVQTVVHLAARAHIVAEHAQDPLSEFRRINVAGTVNLARQAAAAGVRRFIFLSSIKVNGEFTAPNKPFLPGDAPSPIDFYGISKYEAETELRRLADIGMEIVIIRPPLVYGPHVKGNFLRLLSLVYRGVPLPFANVNNRRSLVGIHNVTALIERCITHPAAGGRTFLVSDGTDVSMGDLVRCLAWAMGKRPRLFPVPLSLTRCVLRRLGKENLCQRIFGSLQVNAEMTRDILEWVPPMTTSAGLEEVGRWYLESRTRHSCNW